jgi:hypothetical protein
MQRNSLYDLILKIHTIENQIANLHSQFNEETKNELNARRCQKELVHTISLGIQGSHVLEILNDFQQQQKIEFEARMAQKKLMSANHSPMHKEELRMTFQTIEFAARKKQQMYIAEAGGVAAQVRLEEIKLAIDIEEKKEIMARNNQIGLLNKAEKLNQVKKELESQQLELLKKNREDNTVNNRLTYFSQQTAKESQPQPPATINQYAKSAHNFYLFTHKDFENNSAQEKNQQRNGMQFLK